MRKIYLAGGCFWGVEHYLSLIEGIIHTIVGYANSDIENPTYEDLKAQRSTASETVEVIYDEDRISLDEILGLFYKIIDPTVLDRQGNDIGHQYRTGIYYIDEEDKEVIEKSIKQLATKYDKEIVVEVLPLENFTDAEEYHQDYLVKNPTGYCHVDPKMFDFAKNYKKGDLNRVYKTLKTEFYEYEGETLNDLPDGKGHMKYLNDDYFYSYDGQFKQGKEHGKGKQVCLDGTFECDFVEGKALGYGTIVNPDGDVYKGQIDTVAEGMGTLYYTDGSIYEGEFKNGFPHGSGTLTYPDGETIKGIFLEKECIEEK